MIKFKFLTGDVNWCDFGGKWISQKLNNGDWDYWMVIEVTNVEGYGFEGDLTHVVSLSAVSPEAAGGDHIETAIVSCGWMEMDKDDPRNIVEVLHSYGISALLWQDQGDNPDDLLADAKEQAQIAGGLFGLYMDGYKNRIGHTGWDFIRGDLSIETAMSNVGFES